MIYQYLAMICCFACLILLIMYLLKNTFYKRNYYYSSPFANTEEILLRIKKKDLKLYENLKNEKTIEKFLSFRMKNFYEVFEKNFKQKKFGLENLRKMSEEINIFLLYLNCHKELGGKKDFIFLLIKKYSKNVKIVKNWILDHLSENANCEKFYLQKTLLNYFNDFFKFNNNK